MAVTMPGEKPQSQQAGELQRRGAVAPTQAGAEHAEVQALHSAVSGAALAVKPQIPANENKIGETPEQL
jgi:hypothetical protein